VIEREFFVEEKQSSSVGMDQVFFNSVDLHLTKDPLQKNSLHFSIQPYLMPAPPTSTVLNIESMIAD